VNATAAAGSVREALGAATDALAAAGVDTARLDAELLLAEAMHTQRARLAADPDAGVDPAAARAFGAMVRRRVQREPVAYILGRKAFRRLELAVDPRVLVPRPETELLVEVAIGFRPGSVLDVGTGSGAVALAIADELPDAIVVATDTSPAALGVAAANARRLGLGGRVTWELGSLPPGRPFDLVVANLPYVAAGEFDSLQPEIARYEPREALVAGADGLDAIRGLLGARPRCRAIALEVGEGQADAVTDLVKQAGFRHTERRRDLSGIERVVLGV
jgi:release factor glutamine methyltransferase